MRAAVYTAYGPPNVVTVKDCPKPVPKDNEVLIKVLATTVSSGDWRARSLTMPTGMGLIGRLVFGIFGPRKKVLGTELSGIIQSVGKDVSRFETGDAIIAYPGGAMGAHAEFLCMPEAGAIAPKPANLNFEQAAAIAFGGDTALDFLRDKGEIQSGDKVLIIGASGAVGSAAIQLARHFGADVTGICSAANLELVKNLGADHVIDYSEQDFTLNGERYDLIVDTVGTAPWSRSKASLAPTGRLLLVSGSLRDMLQAAFVSRKHGKRLVPGVAMGGAANLRTLVELTEAGDFNPVIDRTFPLEQIRKAHAHVDTGRKKGSVIINIAENDAKQQSAA